MQKHRKWTSHLPLSTGCFLIAQPGVFICCTTAVGLYWGIILLPKLWLWFSKMFHQRVRSDWKWSISKFQFWQRILDIYRQPLLRSDDGDDNENVKKGKRFNNQNNFSRESRFFVHFFAVTARLRPENACFHFFERKYTSDEISSLSFFLLRNSTFRRVHLW